MTDNSTVSSHDAMEAGAVLDAFLKGIDVPADIDREAVRRVHDAIANALVTAKEHSSVVILFDQKGPARQR